MAIKLNKKLIKLYKHPVLFFRDAIDKRKHGKFANAVSGKVVTKKYKEYFNEITDFAQKYNVNSIKIGKEFLWPNLRQIFWVYISLVAIGRVSAKRISRFGLQNGHFSQMPKHFRRQLKRDFGAQDIAEIEPQVCDFLFFATVNSTEQVEVNSRIYHRLTDPFFEVASKIGTAHKLEMVKSSSFDGERWRLYVHPSELILPPPLQTIGYTTELVYDQRFFTMMQKYVPSLNVLNHNTLSEIIGYEMHTREYYIDLFKKFNPKVICLFGFHYHAPLISAADELGILTVDLQHGLQVGWNPLYNNYDELPYSGYQALPDVFAVWGQKEYHNIRKVFCSEKHKPVFMGSPWLKKIKLFPTQLSQNIIQKLSSHKTRVLLIMQKTGTIPPMFLQIIEQSGSDILWVVRHHPNAEPFKEKDFSKSKNVLIDAEIDTVLFSELFQHVDVAISEGSALAIEASYFGVHNVIVGETGLDNYREEIEKGYFTYLQNAEDFPTILDKISETKREDTVHGFEDVDPEVFLKELLQLAQEKREKRQSLAVSEFVDEESIKDEIEAEIVELTNAMYLHETQGDISGAVELFHKIRLKLGDVPLSEERYQAEQNLWAKEARAFRRKINELFPTQQTTDEIVFVGDSLALPRPAESLTESGGVELTSSYMFNQTVASPHKMVPWGQRYFTTEKLLDYWDCTVGDLKDKNFVVHLGLNDHAERIFLERQRLSLAVLNQELTDKIVKFGQNYRKQIIESQFEHCYVGYEQFTNNLSEIVRRAHEAGARSISFFNIVPFPKSHEIDTPGSIANTEKFNKVFDELQRKFPEINIIDFNSIVAQEGFDKCMLSDNMHLSHYGHSVLARAVLQVVTKGLDSTVRNVAIIGVGQLGSRHLQGLAKIDTPIRIELLEPNEEMRAIAAQRYKELPINNQIVSVKFCDALNELSEKLDLVVIATNADIRAQVVKDLLQAKRVKNLILEKVLFQKLDDYDTLEKLFEKNDVNVWVNHPRREFKFYDKFMPDLRRSSKINYQVSGAEWGLACNGLHFLDHLLYISGQQSPMVSMKMNSSDKVEASKRRGCYEVYGVLTGNIGNSKFSLACEKSLDGASVLMTIYSDNLRLIVDEVKGKILYAYRDNNWNWETLDDKVIEFQSELTGRIAASILRTGTCGLPTYAEASLLHKPFIIEMKKVIEDGCGEQFDVCPIS